MNDQILEHNKTYWNDHADLWFGVTALPELGVYFPDETELNLFGDVTGQRVLEICCGSGHSLRYMAQHGAAELWGADISQKQLENAERLLTEGVCNMSKISFTYEDTEYTLEFDRDTVVVAEQMYGLSLDVIRRGQVTMLPSLFEARPAVRAGERYVRRYGR